MEVFIQRLQNEFEMDVILTTPSVPYRVNTFVFSSQRCCCANRITIGKICGG